jgi:hypothetical protein
VATDFRFADAPGIRAGAICTRPQQSRQDCPRSSRPVSLSRHQLDLGLRLARRRAHPVTITKEEVIRLMKRFHDVVMFDKGTAAEQAAFFFDPEPRISVPHGEDITLQTDYEIHQKLTDEKHAPLDQ